MRTTYSNRPLFYARLDDAVGLDGSAATSHLRREQYITSLYGRPQADYATRGVACHPAFNSGFSINNTSGVVFRSAGMYGRPFPRQGTIEFWMRPNTTISTYDGLFSTNAGTVDGNNVNKIKAFTDAGNAMYFFFMGSGYASIATINLAANTSYLITITWDFSRSYAAVYINGTVYSSSSITAAYQPSTWRSFELGRAKRDGTAYTPDASFNGLYISEQFTSLAEHNAVRISGSRQLQPYNRRAPIATVPEVARPAVLRRTGNLREGITSPWALPGDVLHVHSGRKLAAIGDPVQRQTYCADTRVSATTFAAVQVVQGWLSRHLITLLPYATQCSTATIIAEVDCTYVSSPMYHRFVTVGTEGLCIRGEQSGLIQIFGYISGTLRVVNFGSQYTTGRHIYAATYDGSYIRCYKDGALVGTSALYTGVLSNTYGYIQVNHPTEYVNGQILRSISFNRALSLNEINYWSYGTDYERFFTLPRAALPTPLPSAAARPPVVARKTDEGGDIYYGNVILHLPFQESTRDVSPQRCSVTQYGLGVYSGAQYRPPALINARASYYYDPSSTYLSATVPELGSGAWTIEFWARSPTAGGATGINVDLRNADNDTNGFALYFRSTTKYALGGGNPFTATESSLTWATTTWYHIAAVRRGDTIFVYINGKLQITRSWSASLTRTVCKIGAQHDAANTDEGYLADLRVTKGIARYTTEFTPPSFLLPTHGVAPPYGL